MSGHTFRFRLASNTGVPVRSKQKAVVGEGEGLKMGRGRGTNPPPPPLLQLFAHLEQEHLQYRPGFVGFRSFCSLVKFIFGSERQ